MKKFLFVFIFVLFLFAGLNKASAANCSNQPGVGINTTHECVDMYGYAWGADNATNPPGGVGWINFNNTTTGSNTPGANNTTYKVEFDRITLSLHGYAYSDRYGYIKFGGFTDAVDDFPTAAACEGNTINDSKCNAHLFKDTNGGYQMAGYARFCFVYANGCSGQLKDASELGGNDGWIGFTGTGFQVVYSTSNNEFGGYAWGGGSGNIQNSNYGQGAGWISVNPASGGLKCYVPTGADCIDNNTKPVIEIKANNVSSKLKTNYNTPITLTWTITGPSSNCDTYTAYSTPSNSNWPGTITFSGLTGSFGPFNLNTPTTFYLTCVNGTQTGNSFVTVDFNTYTPDLTLDAPASVSYGGSVDVNWQATNVPFGCPGGANIYNSARQVVANISTIPASGSASASYSGTKTVSTSLTATDQWQFECIDDTPPSPARVGLSAVKTTTVPGPVIQFSVKDNSTNSTATVPCTNTGVVISYNIVSGTNGVCRAVNAYTGWGINEWGSTTIINTTNGPMKDIVTSPITGTGTGQYFIQCQNGAGVWSSAGDSIYRDPSCGTTARGQLDVTSTKTCYETVDPTVDILYSGSDLQTNSCTKSYTGNIGKSWLDSSWSGGQSNFSSSTQLSPGWLGIGNHTFTISNCIEEDYPTNPTLSDSVTIEVANVCNNCTDPCNPSCPNYTSSHRCMPLRGPKFKEQ